MNTPRKLLFVIVALLPLLLTGEGESASYPGGAWQIQGPGTSSVADGENCLEFSYSLSGPVVWSLQTWTFSTTAPATEVIEFGWNHNGFHSWYNVSAEAYAFADGPGGIITVPFHSSNPYGPFDETGTATLAVNDGYDFGFVVRGRNFDRDSRLFGDLSICSRLIHVDLDIKPATVPVAILSTNDFDATTEVDRASLTFGRTGDEDSLHRRGRGVPNCGEEDVNGDGLTDLVCHFHIQRAGFQQGETEGILRGATVGGIDIQGSGTIQTVGRKS